MARSGVSQRRRDDGKRRGQLEAERKFVQKSCFSWETPWQEHFESANVIVEKSCCHCAGTRNFHEKYRKNSFRSEILDSRIGPKFWTPGIYPQKYFKNTETIPPNYQNARFLVFFSAGGGVFGVFSWGSRISAWRGIFSVFFLGRAISGLSNRAGAFSRIIMKNVTKPRNNDKWWKEW